MLQIVHFYFSQRSSDQAGFAVRGPNHKRARNTYFAVTAVEKVCLKQHRKDEIQTLGMRIHVNWWAGTLVTVSRLADLKKEAY